jgi:hypothetical protein
VHRRHVEALLLVAGIVAAVVRRDRRALLLVLPWVHERTDLTPQAGGYRRKWIVLPGALAVDLHDAAAGLALRLRPRQRG